MRFVQLTPGCVAHEQTVFFFASCQMFLFGHSRCANSLLSAHLDALLSAAHAALWCPISGLDRPVVRVRTYGRRKRVCARKQWPGTVRMPAGKYYELWWEHRRAYGLRGCVWCGVDCWIVVGLEKRHSVAFCVFFHRMRPCIVECAVQIQLWTAN